MLMTLQKADLCRKRQPMNNEGHRTIGPNLTLFFGRFLNTPEEMDPIWGLTVALRVRQGLWMD